MTVNEAAHIIADSMRHGGKLLLCGNGGSAAECSHMAGELVGRFAIKDREALPALSLCADTAVLTALANDFGFDRVFARQVEALGVEGDVLLAISTSGNSANLREACAMADALGMLVIILTGGDGGALARYFPDTTLCAPHGTTAEIQQWHLQVIHDLCGLVENALPQEDHIGTA